MHTKDCHLCEQAAEILDFIGVEFRAVDIADDEGLVERYGIRIPVLVRPDGQELGWPFEPDQVQVFVK